MINKIVLLTAITISAIAGYYSVIGLATIFSGAFWSVVVMASALEVGKVVTVAWLSRYWLKTPKVIKYYLSCAVIVLMFITSMGTFGYLSKAHLQQTQNVGTVAIELQQIDYLIKSEERRIQNAQTSLDTLDRLANEAPPDKASQVRQRQRTERQAILKEIKEASSEIETLSNKAVPLRQQTSNLEAEIGPLKYVAELIYGENATTNFDSAVRIIIIIIIMVFDPLALVMLIAANHGMKPEMKIKYNKVTGKIEQTY
jgi:hypothetical protein